MRKIGGGRGGKEGKRQIYYWSTNFSLNLLINCKGEEKMQKNKAEQSREIEDHEQN